MRHCTLGLPFGFSLLVLCAAITLACGSSESHIATACGSASGASSPGVPQSISLCPATVTAQGSEQVQFVATGYFESEPKRITPLKTELWGVCQQNVPTTVVSISNTGVAQCQSGASGAYTVFTSDMTECNVIGPCGSGCQVTGTAQLTCQ
jgi:hypothetical protein